VVAAVDTCAVTVFRRRLKSRGAIDIIVDYHDATSGRTSKQYNPLQLIGSGRLGPHRLAACFAAPNSTV
jgi:hypothetical protein